VATLRRQLGVIMGKTHMVEFAFGGTGHNAHWGAPYNPWDPSAHRAPGGSSSGAGVSLLESSALLALGSDTAGSVRIPASMTGTVGLKGALGRWSTEGVVPLSALCSRWLRRGAWVKIQVCKLSVPQRGSPRKSKGIGCGTGWFSTPIADLLKPRLRRGD
jgi:hypothetical protein